MYVDRDDQGTIIGLYRRPQYEGQERVSDDSEGVREFQDRSVIPARPTIEDRLVDLERRIRVLEQ